MDTHQFKIKITSKKTVYTKSRQKSLSGQKVTTSASTNGGSSDNGGK